MVGFLGRWGWGNLARGGGGGGQEMVDWTLAHYATIGELAWAATYPEMKCVGKGQARATGKALPDRCVAVRELGGRLLWLEIKTWKAKDRHTLRQRLHQFEQMVEFMLSGGALGAYLVAWRWDGVIEWRLYPIMTLSVRDGGITFRREAGRLVKSEGGLPDWLPCVVGEWLK